MLYIDFENKRSMQELQTTKVFKVVLYLSFYFFHFFEYGFCSLYMWKCA